MINVLPWKQSDSARCGPASIKMILSYYGIDALEDEIAARCNQTYELGCTDNDMKIALESYGLAVKIQNNSTLQDLEYWIQHHIPIIVDWFTPGISPDPSDMPNGHSSVVVDIDSEAVYLLDPEDAKIRQIPRNEFLRVWFDWRSKPYLSEDSLDDLVIRQIIIAYPSKLP